LSQTNAQTAVNSEPWLIAQNKGLNPDQALTMLMEGNQRFWERRQKSPNRDQARAHEKWPKVKPLLRQFWAVPILAYQQKSFLIAD
jgi:hypothetical protein